MSRWPAIMVCLCLTAPFVDNFNFLRKKTVKIDKIVGVCPEFPNAPTTLNDIRVKKVGRMYTISTKLVVRKTIYNDMMVNLTLKRCSNRDSPDTCEDYQKLHIKRMCEALSGKNQPWSPFVDAVQPPMKCPVKAGVYVVKNGSFDGDSFAALPIEGWYWKVNARVIDMGTSKVVVCMYLEGQITPV